MFAERYTLKFVSLADGSKDDGSAEHGDSEEEDEDLYENAVEELEIDDSHELYQTLVAAIIEESGSVANDVFDNDDGDEDDSKLKKSSQKNYGVQSSWEDLSRWTDLKMLWKVISTFETFNLYLFIVQFYVCTS